MELVAMNIQNARNLVWIGVNIGIGLTMGYIVVSFIGGILSYFTTPKNNDVDTERMFQELLKKKEEADNKGE
jgi:UPF0716 family protein affecting phage T7 exclusion